MSDDVKDSFLEELRRVFNQLARYDKKILLCDFNAKAGTEDANFQNDNRE
jgi:hypothetical protein